MTLASNEGASRFAGGVGLTALLVAAARAVETHHPQGLVADPFAESFVRSADTPVGLPTRIEDVEGGDNDPVWGRGGQYFALRTRVFDDFLTSANHDDGIRQVVLLGAGLDTRALRSTWQPGTVVYEVDRPDVFSFKREVLSSLGAVAIAPVAHRFVVVDLEGNWADALTARGFDRHRPTAWVIEGVLPYLPAETERRLIATVIDLSAVGSRIAYEILQDQETEKVRNSSIYDDTEAKMGVHLSGLFSPDARPDSARDLGAAGWSVSSESVYRYTEQYGRGPKPGVNDAISHARWVMGRRTTDCAYHSLV
ncbi:SAM-dependent methyltransferase [Streptomyces sp. NPDC001530]|uniref:SAM-dependent methyltransferase n=1 Tax=Streptomyces sp. NPDC001530 TaxID=3364582 RepID=UPI0036D0DE37